MGNKFKDKDLELVIGKLLRGGVVLSMIVSIIGLLLLFFRKHNTDSDIHHLPATPDKFNSVSFAHQLMQGDAKAIILAGILILLATPVLRVIFALFGYWKENDKLYVLVSLIVLAIILLSLFIGAAH